MEQQNNTPVIPNEITFDEFDHLASFEFYSGKRLAKEKNLLQSTNLQDVRKGTHFVVSCGEVIIRVEATDYPDIERRIL